MRPDPRDAADPFHLAALLRAAVDAHRGRTGATMADIARVAWPDATWGPQALSRAIRDGNPTTVETARPILRALGLRVALVPAE